MTPSKIPALREKIFARLSNKELAEISMLELDILKQHIRELYEALDSLSDEIKRSRSHEEVSQPEQVVEKKKAVVVETVKEEIRKKPEILFARAEAVSVKEEKQDKVSQAPLNERITSQATLNEKLKPGALTEVNQKLSGKRLKDLIDLNKKHVMLNELFTGDFKNYSAAIEAIDACPDYESAQTYLSTRLSGPLQWNEKTEAVRLLSSLVRQKFAA